MSDTVSLETFLRMDLGDLLVLRELVWEAISQRTEAAPLETVHMRMPSDQRQAHTTSGRSSST